MELPQFYARGDSPEEPAIFTPFSLIHFLSGMYAYLVLRFIFPYSKTWILFLIWLVLHTLYETKDVFLTSSNSFINSIGDTIAALAGFLVGAAVLCRFSLVKVVIGGLLLITASYLVYEE